MYTLRRIVHVPAPVEDVFAFVADFANLPEWDPGIAAVERVGHRAPGAGARYRVTASFMGREVPMDYEIARWEPHTGAELVGQAPTIRAIDRIGFEPDGAGTRVTWEAEFHMKGPLRWMEKVMGPLFERLADKAMAGLGAATIPTSR